MYTPISSWMLIKILNNVKKEHLDRITFAWFGNRDMIYSNNTTIFPQKCDKCGKELNKFFDNFNSINFFNKTELLNKINNIANSCDCNKKFLEQLQEKNDKSFEECIKENYNFINTNIIKS